ncbi:MAG: hypothetical protein WBP29_06965 [Candidatus Zixiibacteriota bacterium]
MTTVQGGNAGMNTVRNISLIQRSLSKTMSHVSPALEVDAESEAPSELAVSEQLRSQIGSLTDRIKKLELQVNRTKTAEGALSDLFERVKEMRHFAVEASDPAVNTPDNGKDLQGKFNAMAGQYKQAIEQASYGQEKLFDGSRESIATILPLSEQDVSTAEAAKETVRDLDDTLRILSEAKIDIELNSRSEYETTVQTFDIAAQAAASESVIHDGSTAAAEARYLKSMVQSNAEQAASAQGQLDSETVFKLLHA